jgi:predicted nucleic acid-binding protein
MAINSYLVDSNTIISGSKEPSGQVARWLETQLVYATDISITECLTNWKAVNHPDKLDERISIERFFEFLQSEKRLIASLDDPHIVQRAQFLFRSYNIKPADALIAATAEYYDLILVTADTKKDFAPRLLRLIEQGLGRFRLQTYEFANREAIFGEWNKQAVRP